MKCMTKKNDLMQMEEYFNLIYFSILMNKTKYAKKHKII